MITPEYLDEVIKGTYNAVDELNTRLVKKIAKRLISTFTRDGEALLIPSGINEIRQIQQSGMLVKDIEDAVVSYLPTIEHEVRDAFFLASIEMSNTNYDIAKEAIEWLDANGTPIKSDLPKHVVEGLPRDWEKLNMTKREIRLLENVYRRTNGTIFNICQTMPNRGNDAYIRACDRAFMDAKAGAGASTAISNALKELGQRGITTVGYGGREEAIETAVSRAVRTGINQSSAEVVTQRCAEIGYNYVAVSQHLGARVTNTNDYKDHSKWQGKVYHLDWNKPVLQKYAIDRGDIENFEYLKEIREEIQKLPQPNYPDFVEVCGYGEMLGICGINCRHTFSPFYPEIMNEPKKLYTDEENEKRYKITQVQRAKERAIRKSKRLIEVLKQDTTGASEADLSEAKQTLKIQMNDYMAYCNRNGVKPNNKNLMIAK